MSELATSRKEAVEATESSVLWAKASREWVVPPKPKPGRKPQIATLNTPNNDPQTSSSAAVTSENRKGQNRAAQRAFRERKQEQLAELRERIRAYERGEVERHVALQTVARRLKEENEQLRGENARLKDRVETLETTVLESKSKRPSGSLPSLSPPPKRARRLAGASIGRQALEITSLLISTPPSPPLTASSWDNHSTYFPPSLSTTIPRMASSFNDLDGSPSSNDFPPSINDVTPLTFADINPGSLGCGLCSNGGPCLCDEILRGEQPKAPVESSVPLADIEDHPFVQPRSCLLSNPPPYQAPVPLRRRPNTNKTSTIFAIRAPPADATSSTSTCSGDPSNCLACADDPFGKAFCTAVNQSMMAVSPEPCGNCPRLGIDPVITGSGNGCRSPCASCPRRDGPATRAAPLHLSISSSNASVPCNVVWQQIKEHPNASFADLRLLADVVARRSKCTGPRVARSPTPIPQSNSTGSFLDEELLGQEDSSRHTATAPPPPKTTAHGVATHIRCGRSSLREVPAEAVRDALRLLDVIHDQRGLEYD